MYFSVVVVVVGAFNGKTFGILIWNLFLQISLVQHDEDQQQEENDRKKLKFL